VVLEPSCGGQQHGWWAAACQAGWQWHDEAVVWEAVGEGLQGCGPVRQWPGVPQAWGAEAWWAGRQAAEMAWGW
jgi:hypothetical protein